MKPINHTNPSINVKSKNLEMLHKTKLSLVRSQTSDTLLPEGCTCPGLRGLRDPKLIWGLISLSIDRSRGSIRKLPKLRR